MKKRKNVLVFALACLILLQTAVNEWLLVPARAAESDHKVTVFYGYGGQAGTANPATNVMVNDVNDKAYYSTAKYGLTNGDFNDSGSSLPVNRYGQKNAAAAIVSVDILYGDLKYTMNSYSAATLYLSADGKSLNTSSGTKLLAFGGSNPWKAGSSSGVIRFYHIADDLTIVYHYADEVALSVNGGEGAVYSSETGFPGYSAMDKESNVYTGYSRPRTDITEGFDTTITYPAGKTVNGAAILIGTEKISVSAEQMQADFYVNSAYEITTDAPDAILRFTSGVSGMDGTLKVYKINSNISMTVTYEGEEQKEPLLLKVAGANRASANVISSTAMSSYVGAENFDAVNGVVTFQKEYFSETFGAADGLAFSVYSEYGTVESIEVMIGTHTVTFGNEDGDLAISGRWISQDYEKVKAMPESGAKLKYAHNQSSPVYSFRFWEISENITITFHYTTIQVEVVNTNGQLTRIAFDDGASAFTKIPKNAVTVENTRLTLETGYMRDGANYYCYRVKMEAAGSALAGVQICAKEVAETCDLIPADKKSGTITVDTLGTFTYSYNTGNSSNGSHDMYYIRVKAQNVDKLIFKPIIYGDLDRDGKVSVTDLISLREILTGVAEGTALANHNKDDVTDVRDLVHMKKYLSKPIEKIACVGDSITFGYATSTKMSLAESYPGVLESLYAAAGENVEVYNYGRSSSYILSPDSEYSYEGHESIRDRYYPNTVEYQASLECKADKVIIMLGTNDFRSLTSQEAKEEFVNALADLVKIYQNLGATVYVSTSIPAYNSGIANAMLNGTVQALQKQAAVESGAEFLNLYDLIYDDITYDLTCSGGDKLHPSTAGAAMIAHGIFSLLTGEEYQGERAPEAMESIIYVSAAGDNQNNGSDAAHPVASIQYAVTLLRKTGGTICVLDELTVNPSGVERVLPKNSQKITITGEEGAKLLIGGNLYLNGDVEIRNLTLSAKAGLTLYCNSHDFSLNGCTWEAEEMKIENGICK